MIMTPIRPAVPAERPQLSRLEDISADLDTSLTFNFAAERFLNEVAEWLRMYDREKMSHIIDFAKHCETMLVEARAKAEAARRDIIAFHEAEFAARSSDNS